MSRNSLRLGMLVSMLAVTVVACNDTPVGITNSPARIRVINVSYQTTDDANTTSTAQPRAIDFFVDGSASTPGQNGIPADGIYPVQSDDPTSNYVELSQGLHTFSARLAAPAPNTPLFTNNADPRGEFLPKMFFTGDTYYTIIVGGLAPATGLPEPSAFLPTLGWASDYPLLDDNSPPPKTNGAYMAKFRLVNAAVFGTDGSPNGFTSSLFLTDGHTLPTQPDIAVMRASASAPFRKSRTSTAVNPYSNVVPGDYVVTATVVIGSTRTILAQIPVSLTSGEIRTFLLVNTGYAAVPSPSNVRLISLLDAKY